MRIKYVIRSAMSNTELEAKFVVNRPALSVWSDTLKQTLKNNGFSIGDIRQQELKNTYYDTAEQLFERHKMGLRTRGCNDKYEQTIKAQKAVQSGVHERAEYNVNIADEVPDLTLFPINIWQESGITMPANADLVPQFSTHFTRLTVHLTHSLGECELVFDEGEIATTAEWRTLNEIEIELLSGQPQLILKVAQPLMHLGIRLSDASKAAQGYELLRGIRNKIRPLPPYLQLPVNMTTESVFCMGCETAMAHWQYHEHYFFSADSAKMLGEVQTSLRLLLQTLSLFLPVLQCQPLLDLQRKVLAFSDKWLWVDELHATRFLLSKKGPFHKTLNRQGAVISYIHGRQTGLLANHHPARLLYSKEANEIKLAVVDLLMTKPWQNKVIGVELPVIDHAKGWLSQGRQTLHQAMQSPRPLQAINYTGVETLLRQTLFNGFLLSNLFPNSENVRAPWLDLLIGIDEIRALLMLKQALQEAELEFEDGLIEWVDEKLSHLLEIMERTRQVALGKDMYW